MHYRFWLSLALALILAACGSGDASRRIDPEQIQHLRNRQVTVQGFAAVGVGGVSAARQAAIDDAIAQAARTLADRDPGAMSTSEVKVVDEWQDQDGYHVQALVMLSAQKSCNAPYRKRIVATGFPAMNPYQISGTETQDLFGGIPREIGNLLMERGDFIAYNLTDSSLYVRPDLAPEIPASGGFSGNVILDIAKRHNAQLVLSGIIRDFRVESTEYVRGAGVLAELKSAMRDYVGRRSIGIDVFMHDGFTGALLFQHRYTDSIIGDVNLPSGYNVGSERFEDTPSGHKIGDIVRQASQDIADLFSCYPFSARVIRTELGRITIGAGAQDKIKVGDRFMVYSAGFADSAGLGYTDPIGILSIAEVGPSMAAGSLEQNARTLVRPGDWVRSFTTY
ncbi:flagella assembly protein FlgT middle domain-containing protein [Methylomonas rhizoryzae]|uniref:flagella assembly protein FlgT middle domain-containing protein n=1 Tax=Methylomonas rhizoryzae TaxID=2608981 RepID=UPI001231DA53|nr:flagella assembly protein FlgT middle domain-containing protein [Methylomonas rhizoryzae]